MKSLIYLPLLLIFFGAPSSWAGRLSVLYGGGSAGVSFAGYAGPFDGNLGATKAINQKCAAAQAGSHVCSYDEIVRLGANYPYTYGVWLFGGIIAVDGGYYTSPAGGGTSMVGAGNCYAWTNNAAATYGFVLSTTGGTSVASCASTYYLACCK